MGVGIELNCAPWWRRLMFANCLAHLTCGSRLAQVGSTTSQPNIDAQNSQYRDAAQYIKASLTTTLSPGLDHGCALSACALYVDARAAAESVLDVSPLPPWRCDVFKRGQPSCPAFMLRVHFHFSASCRSFMSFGR